MPKEKIKFNLKETSKNITPTININITKKIQNKTSYIKILNEKEI